MKYSNINRLVLLLLFLSSVACDNILEENPQSLITRENFYKTEADAIAGINAVYAVMNDNGYYRRNFWILSEVSADYANHGEVTGGVDELDFISFDNNIRGYWTSIYKGVNHANTVLTNVPEISFDEKVKNRILGESRFLRALFYFDLVRAFGDVPLITSPTSGNANNEQPRADKDKVYELIIEDLSIAEDLLPDSYGNNDIGRATKGAAKALLAKVYLTLGDWELSLIKSKEVVDMGIYSLFPDFRDVFKVENENGQEHIFSVQFEPGSSDAVASSFTTEFASRNPNILLDGLRAGAGITAERYFFDEFPDHYRKSITLVDSFPSAFYPEIIDETGTVQTGAVCMKYWDPNLFSESQGDANWIVLRYADILLMMAEAENEVNGPTSLAYDAINEVRKRARDANANGVDEMEEIEALPDLEGLNKAEFREAVLRERELELCFEGHKRWDLLRKGKYIEAMQAIGKPVENKHILYPIPQLELLANPNLTQNPGYPD